MATPSSKTSMTELCTKILVGAKALPVRSSASRESLFLLTFDKSLQYALVVFLQESPVSEQIDLLQGTLDMLVLRTLQYGPAHGHQIGKHIQRTTNDFLASDGITRGNLLIATTPELYSRVQRIVARVTEDAEVA